MTKSRLWTRASLPDVIFCEMDAGLIEYDTVTKKATWQKTTRVEKTALVVFVIYERGCSCFLCAKASPIRRSAWSARKRGMFSTSSFSFKFSNEKRTRSLT